MAPDPKSFYWYDLETTGLNRRWDRITQFAGQRTDLELNPIDEPYVTYVKLPPEVLPDPDATLVTGVPPQEIQAQGISEWEAINEIHERFMVPGTCAIGYNSIAFDDEFIRFALYRNLFPPYAREFRRGNSSRRPLRHSPCGCSHATYKNPVAAGRRRYDQHQFVSASCGERH